MAVIKFSIPDAWVQENNYVYGVVDPELGKDFAINAMNLSLLEWDYPVQVTTPDQVREMWVEPETLLHEDWNPNFVSSDLVHGWVHLLYANAEEL